MADENNNTSLSDILSRLMFEHRIKATELARKIDIPQPTIHRIATGKSPNPHKQSLEAIAKYFSITVSQLKGDSPLPASTLVTTHKTTAKQAIQVPILPWQALSSAPSDQLYQYSSEQSLVAASSVNPKAFAVAAPDNSMQPNFNLHTLLIFDPDKPANDRNYVLTHCKNGKFLFRQLLIDDDYHYLNPLNPDKNQYRMRVLEKGDKIIATLIEARRQYEDL